PGAPGMWWGRGSFSRATTSDKRGRGRSAPPMGYPTLEERMDDVRAVIDAAGGRRELALFGFSEGGPMAILFAATYPERVRALVLYGTFMRLSHEPESVRRWEQVRDVTEEWGTGR